MRAELVHNLRRYAAQWHVSSCAWLTVRACCFCSCRDRTRLLVEDPLMRTVANGGNVLERIKQLLNDYEEKSDQTEETILKLKNLLKFERGLLDQVKKDCLKEAKTCSDAAFQRARQELARAEV
eukprot:COSAG06_NODE_41013_length_396_cov_0.686869_1_plen_123_part_01